MGDALVTSQCPAGFVHKITEGIRFSGVPTDESGVVAIRDKTDVLTVRLSGVKKAQTVRQLPGLRFMEGTQWKLGVGQLLLGQHIEYIALVLACVKRLFQQIPTVFPLDPGIMASGDGVAAQEGCPVIEMPEFQVAVAVDTGIGRPPLPVGIRKAVHHLTAKLIGEVKNVVGNPQTKRHAAGILHILQRAAGAATGNADVLVAVKGHGSADAVPAAVLQKVSGDAGINAAAHCDQYLTHQTMGQPPSQCSQSGNLLWS